METKHCKTFWCKIYISGYLTEIEHICREFVDEVGLCVTVTPTKYIYTGGEEAGVEIGLIRYPRFADERSNKQLGELAMTLAIRILERTGQQSFSVMSPNNTIWYSIRDELNSDQTIAES